MTEIIKQKEEQDKSSKLVPSDVVSPGAKLPPAPTSNLEFIKSIVGNDILEIFGGTGTCKSKFVHQIALEALKENKKIYYLDTERNLSNRDIEALGKYYTYTPVFSDTEKLVQSLPKVDVVIIDSIGLPILTKFAKMDMKKKGDALLSLIALMGDLKEYSFKNDALVIVTNQPESEFNKAPGTIRNPFGDKSCFVVKEIWKTEKLSLSQNLTKSCIKSFRSRTMGKDTNIFTIEVSNTGTKITR